MQVLLDDYAWAATLATELVNTVPGVWSGIDKLPDADALATFLREHAPGSPELADAAAPAAVPGVHALRGEVLELITHPDADHLVAGAAALTRGVDGLTLVPGGKGQARWAARADGALADRLGVVCGVGILGVVRALGPDRFRPCASETCSGVFIDSSRPGSRRYCMPGHCGNRVNVAAHRARRAAR